jgi:dipeptidyl aminopeptidase/acylaminoacyl peptidase
MERCLYFRKMTDEELEQNRLLKLVTRAAPPAFLAHSSDDDSCKVEEFILYAKKSFTHDVPVEMHLFVKGNHRFGLGRKEDGINQWVKLFVNWGREPSK